MNPDHIIVCGDVAVDWLDIPTDPIAKPVVGCDEKHCQNWSLNPGTRRKAIGGGAYLITELVRKSLGTDAYNVYGPVFDEKNIPGTDRGIHSYLRLAKYCKEDKKKKDEIKWRIMEYLGYNGPSSPADLEAIPFVPADRNIQAKVLVIDDAANGFRMKANAGILDEIISKDTYVIYKMARPLNTSSCQFKGPRCSIRGKILDLEKKRNFKLFAILDINDLRTEGAAISHSLSWERLAWDVLHYFRYQPEAGNIFPGDFPGWVIIRVSLEGSIIIPPGFFRKNSNKKITMVFHPAKGEDDEFEPYRNQGNMTGYSGVFTASIACMLARIEQEGDVGEVLIKAVKTGLVTARSLLEQGYVINNEINEGYPLDSLSKVINDPGIGEYFEIEVPDVPENYHFANVMWSIAEIHGLKGMEKTAKDIVIHGFDFPDINIPRAVFKEFITFDRSEIESYRTIKKLVREYLDAGVQDRPLSLAVFGKPGSGKSFGVKTVVKSLLPEKAEVRTFNLSEFQKPEDLSRAFHIVHDLTRDGTLPLIFFDEFDCTISKERLGWLKYFLAPMQDGKFNDGSDIHPIGRAIFVFAGGTRFSYNEFADQEFEEDNWFSKAKGPDFLSRLRGYVDIMGVEPANDRDYSCVIRRAVLLRSQIESRKKTLKDKAHWLLSGGKEAVIDPGVLHALLKVPSYKNGARSVTAILESCELSISKGLNKATLPPAHLLSLHVDFKRFMELVMSADFDNDIFIPSREKLAMQVHEHFCKNNPVSVNAVPWSKLNEAHKRQNRYQVDSFIRILRMEKLFVELESVSNNEVKLNSRIIEKLAIAEHNRWMRDKIAQGYKFGKNRNDVFLTHPDLKPWDKLDVKTRKKDIEAVAMIPKLLQSIGLRVIRK